MNGAGGQAGAIAAPDGGGPGSAATGGRTGGIGQAGTGGGGNGGDLGVVPNGGGGAAHPSGAGGRGGTNGGAAGISGALGTGGAAGAASRGGAGGIAGDRPGTGGQRTGGGAGNNPIAQIISIDFVGGRPVSSGDGRVMDLPAMKPTDVAGVKQMAHWNAAVGLTGSLPTLTAADGTVTTATVAWNSPPGATGAGTWWCGFADAPGDVRMMNGYLDPHSAVAPQAPATVVVTNLPAKITAAGYDVYVYVQGDVSSGAVRTGKYYIGPATFTVTAKGPSPATLSGYVQIAPPGGSGNYVIFRKVTGATFTLLAAPESTGRAPVNGIQIVAPAEP